VNRDTPKLLQLNFSGLGCWLSLILGALLLSSIGLGWVVNGFIVVIALVVLTPILAFLGFRWWVQSKLVENSCPICQYDFTGFNGTTCRCPNCDEPLKVEKGEFKRMTTPGTIDVEAVEVETQPLEN